MDIFSFFFQLLFPHFSTMNVYYLLHEKQVRIIAFLKKELTDTAVVFQIWVKWTDSNEFDGFLGFLSAFHSAISKPKGKPGREGALMARVGGGRQE